MGGWKQGQCGRVRADRETRRLLRGQRAALNSVARALTHQALPLLAQPLAKNGDHHDSRATHRHLSGA